MDPLLLILGASAVLIISFLCNVVARKTNIPSVLMLMLLGFAIQQFTQFEQEMLKDYLEVIGIIGVILIVLEAALDLKLEKEKAGLITKSAFLAIILLLLTTAVIAVGIYLVYGGAFINYFNQDLLLTDVNRRTWYVCFLYAIPLAVMSSAIIIPSVSGLINLKKEFLIFESAFSDILGIILFYSYLAAEHSSEGSNLMVGTVGNIFLTLVLSVLISYGLIILFQNIKGAAKLSLLIAILLGLYALGKYYHLSPLILVLVFGLMLNNQQLFFFGPLKRFVQEKPLEKILDNLHLITQEVAFMVRTFFFVIFGMSIILAQVFHWSLPVITLIALLAIYAPRFLGLKVTMGKDIYPEVFVAPRGLITVLLFYAIPENLIPLRVMGEAADGSLEVQPIFEPGILVLVILSTSLIMTYGLIRDARLNRANKKKEEAKGGDPSSSSDSKQGQEAEGGKKPESPREFVSNFPPPGQELD